MEAHVKMLNIKCSMAMQMNNVMEAPILDQDPIANVWSTGTLVKLKLNIN